MTPIRDIALRLPSDLLSGFALLTRLPLPNHRATGAASAWTWPLVGAVLGGIGAALASGALWLGVTPGVTAVLVLALGAMLTGGLHEDGLSDTADGLYGGWTKERRLEILKDSRVGSFGVLAL
ncbi:adenosylcobinamide-GDP ribazoletransferase, partial [Tabrizicola sp.]|uniref:adenosylcobinamide-GDP ribazoletransferase n=1 Tax=Tabrizicola sp. TaxID=2005166 RepID=UPI002FDE9447